MTKAEIAAALRNHEKTRRDKMARLLRMWLKNEHQRCLHAAVGGTANSIVELTVFPWMPATADAVPPVTTEWTEFILEKLRRIRNRCYRGIDARFKDMEEAEDEIIESRKDSMPEPEARKLGTMMKRMRDLRRHGLMARVLPKLAKGLLKLVPRNDFDWVMMQEYFDDEEWELLADKNYSDIESNGEAGSS